MNPQQCKVCNKPHRIIGTMYCCDACKQLADKLVIQQNKPTGYKK